MEDELANARFSELEGKTRKVRVHKLRPPSTEHLSIGYSDDRNAKINAQMAGLIPGLFDLSLSSGVMENAQQTASTMRRGIQTREESRMGEVQEMQSIFDMAIPHPVDDILPSESWVPQERPEPRKIVLSHYQYEMINYQRMLMRGNIWYYRDRMNVPRGPCPLHVLKDAWVQGCVDENTLMWGTGLYDWLPAKNIKLLLPMIRTPEVRFGSWVKRTFSLKPALNSIRAKTGRDPNLQTSQIEAMR